MVKFRGLRSLPLLTAWLLLAPAVTGTVAQAAEPAFPTVEMLTLDKQDFVFPADMDARRINIVLLAMSEDQDNGTWQGDALVDWYTALEAEGVLSDDVKAWHFSVLKVPFFVKKIIRNGMADEYEGKLPLNQAGPIYIKKLPEFAAQVGIELDGQPNIVIADAAGTILQAFKGEVSPERLAAVIAAAGAG